MSRKRERPDRVGHPTTTPQGTPGAPATCDDAWCELPLNEREYVFNNLWNTGACHPGGSQSISVQSPSSWSTTFNWQRSDDWQVTSYAATILGWHYGYALEDTGLPLRISGTDRVLADLTFTMDPPQSESCRYDVAFDCWCQEQADPHESERRFELMVWFAYSQDYLGYGANYLDERPTIGGLTWKVLPLVIRDTDRTGEIDTVSFLVDGPNVWSAQDFDVTEFLRWIVSHRELFPASDILDGLGGWYLTGVEFGTEAYKGAGTLTVSQHVVRVVPASAPTPSPPDGLTPELKAQLVIMALSESVKQGNENVQQGLDRAIDLVEAIWQQVAEPEA